MRGEKAIEFTVLCKGRLASAARYARKRISRWCVENPDYLQWLVRSRARLTRIKLLTAEIAK
jgi:hypothetical protein